MNEFEAKLKNGKAMTNTGQKDIAFNPDTLEIRPVLYRVYSGHVPDRGTIQGVNNGDVVVSLVWDKDGEQYKVYKYGIDTLPRVDQYHIGRAIWDKYEWIHEWMMPCDRSETIIPESVIPPEEYLSNKVKLARIKSVIERFGIPYNDLDFLDSRKQDLKYTPRILDVDLNTYESTCFKHSEGCRIDQEEIFFGSNGNCSGAVQLQFVPSYLDEHLDWRKCTSGIPGVIGWDKWKYILRIRKGVLISNGVSHGMSIDIWVNRNINPLEDIG